MLLSMFYKIIKNDLKFRVDLIGRNNKENEMIQDQLNINESNFIKVTDNENFISENINDINPIDNLLYNNIKKKFSVYNNNFSKLYDIDGLFYKHLKFNFDINKYNAILDNDKIKNFGDEIIESINNSSFSDNNGVLSFDTFFDLNQNIKLNYDVLHLNLTPITNENMTTEFNNFYDGASKSLLVESFYINKSYALYCLNNTNKLNSNNLFGLNQKNLMNYGDNFINNNEFVSSIWGYYALDSKIISITNKVQVPPTWLPQAGAKTDKATTHLVKVGKGVDEEDHTLGGGPDNKEINDQPSYFYNKASFEKNKTVRKFELVEPIISKFLSKSIIINKKLKLQQPLSDISKNNYPNSVLDNLELPLVENNNNFHVFDLLDIFYDSFKITQITQKLEVLKLSLNTHTKESIISIIDNPKKFNELSILTGQQHIHPRSIVEGCCKCKQTADGIFDEEITKKSLNKCLDSEVGIDKKSKWDSIFDIMFKIGKKIVGEVLPTFIEKK